MRTVAFLRANDRWGQGDKVGVGGIGVRGGAPSPL